MNRWCFSGIVLLVLVVLSLIPGATSQTQCDVADTLFKEGKYEEALTVYTALLRENPNLECAQKGKRIAEAALHVQAGHYYERGQAYEAAGEMELAREAYIDALKKDPTFVEATKELNHANKDIITRAKKIFLQSPKIFVEVLLKSVILVLAGLAAWWRIRPWICSSIRNRSRLNIEYFDEGPLNLKIGRGLATMVEDEFKDIVNERDKPLVRLVEGPITLRAPADIKSGGSPIKMISELIEWAFPQKIINLCGCLQISRSLGAALTVKLMNNQTGEIIAARTMWQKDFDLEMRSGDRPQPWNTDRSQPANSQKITALEDVDPADYYCLAKPAAIWTLFRLAEYEGESLSGLGTENWKSYFFSQDGLNLDLHGNKKEAETKYVKALHLDPKNRSALSNLGILKTETAAFEKKPYKYEQALDLFDQAVKHAKKFEKTLGWLEWVKKTTGQQDNNKIHGDNVWFIAMRQMANAYSYKGKHENKREEKDINEGKEKAENLRDAVEETLRVLEDVLEEYGVLKNFTKPVKEYLKEIKEVKEYLEKMQPLILMQCAIRFADAEDRKAEELKNKAITKVIEKNKQIEDYLELIKEKEKAIENVGDKGKMAKSEEETPSQSDPKTGELEKKRKKCNEERIIPEDRIPEEVRLQWFPKEIQYDLACYYSVSDENKDYKKTLKYLESAFLEGDYYVWWAKWDPDLRGVRKEKKKDFGELIKKYSFEKTRTNQEVSKTKRNSKKIRNNRPIEAEEIYSWLVKRQQFNLE